MIQNHGHIDIAPRPSDYMAGSDSPIVYEQRLSSLNWQDYITAKEPQRNIKTETMACTSFSASHCIEMQMNWLLRNDRLTFAQKQWLQTNGYLDASGNCNLSERFLAKVSGTTPLGNNFLSVLDVSRTLGMVPYTDWPFTDQMTWEEFYSAIPAVLLAKAKKFLQIVGIQYQWIAPQMSQPIDKVLVSKMLAQAPIQISIPIPSTHAIVLSDKTGSNYWVYDSYDPYEYPVSFNYKIYSAIQPFVSPQTMYVYFSAAEVAKWKLQPIMWQFLDKGRAYSGVAYKGTSGLRTSEENKTAGGVSNSAHLRGLAFDMECTDNFQRWAIIHGLQQAGPCFIEVCKGHIHVDIDASIHTLGQIMISDDE